MNIITHIAIVENHDQADIIYLTLDIPKLDKYKGKTPEDTVTSFRVPSGTGREWWKSHLPWLEAEFINPIRQIKNVY